MGVCFCVGELGFGEWDGGLCGASQLFQCRQERQVDVFYPIDQLRLSGSFSLQKTYRSTLNNFNKEKKCFQEAKEEVVWPRIIGQRLNGFGLVKLLSKHPNAIFIFPLDA